MKKKNEAFSKFLDSKYIPMERKYKLLLTVLLFLIPAVAFYFIFLQPNLDEIKRLEANKTKLEKELKLVKKRAKDLPRLKTELAAAELEFAEKSALLPKEKEIPQLLRDISALGRTTGLDFLTFKPMASVPKDFYAEIPVTINVRGPYHNVGSFFDQVSKLERIVSVTNVNMSAPRLEEGEMLLKSNCRLVTYMFTNKPLPKPKKK